MVEEPGVGGPHALGAEVFGCFDDAGAEELLPEAIDGDTGGEGILLIHEPVGEVHAGGRVSCGVEWREKGGGVSGDFGAELVVVTSDAYVGGLHVLALAHDHGTADLAKVGIALFLNFCGLLFGFFEFCADLFFRQVLELGVASRDYGEGEESFDFGDPIIGGFCLSIKLSEFDFLIFAGEVDVGWLKAAKEIGSAASAGFGRSVKVVEEGIHLVEILLGDGVVFVIVADGAAHGEAHEGSANG